MHYLLTEWEEYHKRNVGQGSGRTNCSFEVALAWCTNAKNLLQNVHGFLPFQLALEQNPKLLSVINDKPPACTPQSNSKILMDNLNAIHKAREAFVMSENSEEFVEH